MLPSLGFAVLPSDVSPAALDASLSALSLGLHCVEDTDVVNPVTFCRLSMPEFANSSRTPRLRRSSNLHRCINASIVFRVCVSGVSAKRKSHWLGSVRRLIIRSLRIGICRRGWKRGTQQESENLELGPWLPESASSRQVHSTQLYYVQSPNRGSNPWTDWAHEVRNSQPDYRVSSSSTWHASFCCVC